MKILQFKADWCGPCTQQAELLEDFNAVPVDSIDVDENQELANNYSVRSIPTLILLDEGGVVEQWTGVTQPEEIEDAVAANE